jgi:hypothetical protein
MLAFPGGDFRALPPALGLDLLIALPLGRTDVVVERTVSTGISLTAE